MIFGECDACAAPNRVLHTTIAYGIETAACNPCFGNPLSDDADELRDEIDRVKAMPACAAQLLALEGALAEAEAGVSP